MKSFSALFSGAAILALTGVIASAPPAKADAEWEEFTPYYEDDAWYDVSEWFDGNDYNPTDEVVGRWDDETYEAWQDTGSDVDNDWGFYDNDIADNDWFYDYYDYDYDYDYDYGSDANLDTDENLYRYTYRYYDYDDDHFYDAYTAYYDWDGDGVYEDVDYFSFNDLGAQSESQQQAKKEAGESAPPSKAYTVTGAVQQTKTATVDGAKHTVVLMKQENSGNNVAVDLGRQDRLQDVKLEAGTKIRVRGPMAKIGDKPIVMAETALVDGKTLAIDRKRQSRQGKIVDLHEMQLRGEKHLLAIIQAERNKDQKLAVDLGAVDRLKAKVEKGDRIQVAGVPVKAGGKRLLMAQSLVLDGELFPIARNKLQREKAAAEGGARE